jgi:hypothetical protein
VEGRQTGGRIVGSLQSFFPEIIAEARAPQMAEILAGKNPGAARPVITVFQA